MEAIYKATKIAIPVRKIVCFGLGQLNEHYGQHQGSLQHLTAIDVAQKLDKIKQTAS
jgi:hypothetical protein